ncbi:MAG: HD domain-containing protein [Dissulfuribacterales bacterium]
MQYILEVIYEVIKNHEPYLAGGAVRDLLLKRPIKDMDITVRSNAMQLAREISARLNAAFVPLDVETDTARVVVSRELVADLSSFRDGAASIIEDLNARDFTINAMATPFENAMALICSSSVGNLESLNETMKADTPNLLIDPLNGLHDLNQGIIRAIDRKNLFSDPLRCIRAYRFTAQLGIVIEPQTRNWIHEAMHHLDNVACERIQREMSLILGVPDAHSTIHQMADDGILFHILPELEAGKGMEQPGFHHLDVLSHSLETLKCLESVIQDPTHKFSPSEPITAWLDTNPSLIEALKWAALLHDVAKPVCRSEKNGRTTFYQHDSHGNSMIKGIAARLRWPRHTTLMASTLAALHMRPFHLLTDMERRKTHPTKRAMRRLLNHMKQDYPALFLLAMADSMAGCGPLKPADLDERLSRLWCIVHHFYVKELHPLQTRKRLLTGKDIQEILRISPGPEIGKALNELEIAELEGRITTREQASNWLKDWYVSHAE